MKLTDITKESVRKISDQELLNLHYRVHQLYQNARKRNNTKKKSEYKHYHTILVVEIKRRGLQHKSKMSLSLLEFYSFNF